jgi:hypothetical protein
VLDDPGRSLFLLKPTGAVPPGLRWNMTASAQIDAAR